MRAQGAWAGCGAGRRGPDYATPKLTPSRKRLPETDPEGTPHPPQRLGLLRRGTPAARRKQQDAERGLMAAEEDVEKLAAELERVRAEAGRLADLNDRVAQAKSIHDLVSS
jgi:hypothetical protein